ncbi:MAG: inorganic phosphate transporter, partial [Gemmataceae bacterium]
MSELFGADLSTGMAVVLFFALFVAFGFEFINGFHDTANAVATVIYTRALKPWVAVIWSGFCNFSGVMLSGVAVAFAIVHLLPVDALVGMGQNGGLVMVLSILIAAVIWNFGTWYLGLPASSSHTLIGAILGVGLASSIYMGRSFGSGVNWGKAYSVLQSLLFSPLFGFCLAGALLLLAMKYIKSEVIHSAPEGDTPPPPLLRGLLIFTCTGVSFAHGSNDGQKGVGLIMLILIGILPGVYALDDKFDSVKIKDAMASIDKLEAVMKKHAEDKEQPSRRKYYRSTGRHVPGNYYRDWDHVQLATEPIPPEPDAIVGHLELIRKSI